MSAAENKSATPMGAKDADDLLAKLAGDEIDRLLAEADAERPGTLPAGVNLPDSDTFGSSAAADAAATERASSAFKVADPAVDAPVAGAAGSTPLDSYLGSIAAGGGKHIMGAAHDPAVNPTLDAGEQARLDQLARDLELDEPRSGARHADEGVSEHASKRGVPLYLLPLVWINAPIRHTSSTFRAAMGKVAIITLINAMAVIAYVVLVRRHHL